MNIDFRTQPRVWMSIAAALMLHGCNDNEQNTAADAKLTVSIPQASTRSQRAARTAVPEYVQAITVTVLDAAERPIASGEIPATGGTLALTVPPNLALHVTGAALDKDRNTRFSGSQEVPPIAAGTTASVSLRLEALTPLSTPVQSAEQGPLTVVENTKNIAMITTNAKPDQHVIFAITDGVDRKYFSIDASSGQLSFAVNPLPTFANPQDADRNNVYEVQVTFTDGFESVIQDLKVAVVQPLLFITYEGATSGWKLWRTNGTPEGTFGLLPAAAYLSGSDTHVVLFNAAYYFTATDSVNGTALWTTNGTVEGTKILLRINSNGREAVNDLTVFNGALYFSALKQDTGGSTLISRLWTSNGAPAGTKLVAAAQDYIQPTRFMVFKGELYFNAAALTSTTGRATQFLKTDGATLSLIKSSLSPLYGFAEYQGMLYFGGEDGNSAYGAQLWRSDGTPGRAQKIWDASSGPGYGRLSEMTVINDVLYLSADNGILGSEPWAFNAKTMMVPTLLKDINPSLSTYLGSDPRYFTAFNGLAYFSTGSFGLWKSSGSAAGTEQILSQKQLVPGPLTLFNGALYFQGQERGINFGELWKYNGTTAPQLVKKICTEGCGQFLSAAPTVFNGELYYYSKTTVSGVSGVWLMKLGSLPGSEPQPLHIICSVYCNGLFPV